MEIMFFVYKLTHKPTGKSYIGRTDNMELASKSLFEIAKKGAVGQFWDILRESGATNFEMSNLHATEDMRENDSMFYYYTNEYASYLFMEAYKVVYKEETKVETTVTHVSQESVPEAVLSDPEPILLTEKEATKKPMGRNGPLKVHLVKKANGDMVRIAGFVKACEHYGISYQMMMKNGKTKGWELVARDINLDDNPEIPYEEYL